MSWSYLSSIHASRGQENVRRLTHGAEDLFEDKELDDVNTRSTSYLITYVRSEKYTSSRQCHVFDDMSHVLHGEGIAHTPLTYVHAGLVSLPASFSTAHTSLSVKSITQLCCNFMFTRVINTLRGTCRLLRPCAIPKTSEERWSSVSSVGNSSEAITKSCNDKPAGNESEFHESSSTK